MAFTKAGAKALAQALREGLDDKDRPANDLRQWLSDALRDSHESNGYSWCYLVDFKGDGESGLCYYVCDGDLTQAPYAISQAENKVAVTIDFEAAKDVVVVTTYAEEVPAAEAKPPVTPAQEAGARHSRNDTAILDRIHEDAVALGATCKSSAKESTQEPPPAEPEPLALAVESVAVDITGEFIPLREGAVGQDGTVALKLIAPGWGSCGYYPDKVLERDGPKIFKTGCKNFWNHQTEAEEAARPEGDLRDLASVLTEDAHYEANGPAGPGLYARGKVFEQFRQPVDDLAKHIGMSIRASGKAREGIAPDGKKGRIIEELTHGVSVDYVTTPGAGGQILQLFEAARTASKPAVETPAPIQETTDMTAAEQQQLNDVLGQLRKLKERQAVVDAGGAIDRYFSTIRVSEGVRARVKGRLLAGAIPLTESGDLDEAKIKEAAQKETQEELEFLSRESGGRLVVNMGTAQPAPQTEAQQRESAQQLEKARIEEAARFASLIGFGPTKRWDVARSILREGRSAFDYNYNAREAHNAMPISAATEALGMEL